VRRELKPEPLAPQAERLRSVELPIELPVEPLEVEDLEEQPDTSDDFEEQVMPVERRELVPVTRILEAEPAGKTQGFLERTLKSDLLHVTSAAAEGVTQIMRTGLGFAGSTELDDYGRDDGLVRRLGPLADFLYRRYWRVHVLGAENLPSGPAILVANHSGALPFDGPVIHSAIRRERPELPEARWLVEDQVFHAPILGTLINRLGAVRACPENAVRLLEEGRPVVVFPEGIQGIGKPFSERYQLKRFGRGGFVKLARRMRVPIIPVAVVGAEETMPMLLKLPARLLGLPYLPITPLGPVPLPAKWTIQFGEPIDAFDRAESADQEAESEMTEVQRLTDRTRDVIDGMLTTLLRERSSVF
jgi:1-acyl-sn-glycerol-3-phosphate acyltransferase